MLHVKLVGQRNTVKAIGVKESTCLWLYTHYNNVQVISLRYNITHLTVKKSKTTTVLLTESTNKNRFTQDRNNQYINSLRQSGRITELSTSTSLQQEIN